MEFDATFLIAVISFIVFVVIMNKVFYAPVLKIMRERRNVVEDNFNNAEKAAEETKKQILYRNGELEKSREEARLKVARESQNLKRERSKEIAQYKEELSVNVEKERENLKNSAIAAKETLKDSVVDIAKEISSVLLGDYIDTNPINKSQIKEEEQY